jgi:hypothetical protein
MDGLVTRIQFGTTAMSRTAGALEHAVLVAVGAAQQACAQESMATIETDGWHD